MSISLNDHENRIKVLEGKGSRKWEVLWHKSWTPNVGGNGTIVDLGKPYTQYDMLLFEIVGWGFQHTMTACSLFTQTSNEDYIYNLYDSGDDTNYIKITPSADHTKIKIKSKGVCYLNYIFALKLYYNFSYNIYCLICTFLEFLFKEV